MHDKNKEKTLYMTEEMMAFKCFEKFKNLLKNFFGLYCQEIYLETQTKIYSGALFAKIFNNF